MRFRGTEIPGDDRREDVPGEEGCEEVRDGEARSLLTRELALRVLACCSLSNPAMKGSMESYIEQRSGEDVLKVPRTDPLAHASLLKILHQSCEAWLRFLSRHGGAFDRADGLHRGVLVGGGEAVDVLEDVG